jgi:sn-glycerol 3-phosphate transport system substrate-binding protein
VALAAAKLKASGHKCPFTTSWQSWTQLESFSAWHNVEFATKATACAAWTRAWLSTPAARAPHREPGQHGQAGPVRLQGPRQCAADATFVSGECAMVTGSSALYGNVKRNAKFASASAPCPTTRTSPARRRTP